MSKCRFDLSQDCHSRDCLACVLDKLRAEIHATAELHEDGDYYLRDEWIDEIFDKYMTGSEGEGNDERAKGCN